jgi:hypothetical protein
VNRAKGIDTIATGRPSAIHVNSIRREVIMQVETAPKIQKF